jgi:hypothetical protein
MMHAERSPTAGPETAIQLTAAAVAHGLPLGQVRWGEHAGRSIIGLAQKSIDEITNSCPALTDA